MNNNLELKIPIYLDTNLLLDLLASLEDGFSTVSKITTNNVENENTTKKGGFGLPTKTLDGSYNYKIAWYFAVENGKYWLKVFFKFFYNMNDKLLNKLHKFH